MLLEPQRIDLDRGATRSRRGDAARRREVRRARAGRLPAARRDHRLHGEPARSPSATPSGSRAASTSSRRTRGRTAAPIAYYQDAQAPEPRGAHAFPVRGDGRRGPAGDPDAARSARDRRRDPQHREASSPARSRTCSTCSTASAVLGDRARSEGDAATPSPIRATTCRAWTSRARSSSSAREMGLELELADVEVESLVPAALEKARSTSS